MTLVATAGQFAKGLSEALAVLGLELKAAIIEAVKFDDDCFKYFKWDGDFWDCVVRAVAQEQRKHPGYLDTNYRDARNHVAYYMK